MESRGIKFKTMRLSLRVFAILDAISAAFLGMQVWQIVSHLEEVPDNLLSKEKAGAMVLMFISLFITMYGLFVRKKFGFITYYIQFPFRLVLWVFSLGFITLLPEAFSYYGDGWFEVLFRICIIAEFFRLYFTIQFHRKLL